MPVPVHSISPPQDVTRTNVPSHYMPPYEIHEGPNFINLGDDGNQLPPIINTTEVQSKFAPPFKPPTVVKPEDSMDKTMDLFFTFAHPIMVPHPVKCTFTNDVALDEFKDIPTEVNHTFSTPIEILHEDTSPEVMHYMDTSPEVHDMNSLEVKNDMALEVKNDMD